MTSSIVDTNGNPIDEPDLAKGFVVEITRVKDGAIPPDGKDKHAYSDDDFETVLVYKPYALDEKTRQLAIMELKQKLSATDYIAAKLTDRLADCTSLESLLSVTAEFNAEYADTLKQRQEWRNEINELETKVR